MQYFYISKDASSQWRWKFVSTNGKTIAVSSESYHNLEDCENSIVVIKSQSPTSKVIGDDHYSKLR
ncbi:YegP family protein [Planctopirus hydrillae]|uniref:DUF1508 domain-containing protein n=1 Tax=Planctopirus hydrillae TaxID=1841610 RepID=A0A1C3EU47_9PLAN|nr:DUF1508 domain-containing protein [Planctopirus hydrillae]ODA36633.1 hypothetical protein A6X21_15895 [Planctopirus hydrillae]